VFPSQSDRETLTIAEWNIMVKGSFKMRSLGLALALALAVQPILGLGGSVDSAAAGVKTPITTVVAGGSSGTSAGGFIVGGIFVSVASIIACSMLVGAEEGREMTLEEALLSGVIPLGCLFRDHLAD
jgi:hypothetical protein